MSVQIIINKACIILCSGSMNESLTPHFQTSVPCMQFEDCRVD